MEIFSRAYPKYDSVNRSWKNGLFSAMVVLMVFLLFQPFGFRDKELGLKLILFPAYAFLAFAYSYFNFRVIRHILHAKKSWTLWNELVSFAIGIILLTVVVYLFTYRVSGDMPLSLKWYFKLLYHVGSLFLIIGNIEFFYYNHRSSSIYNQQLNSKYEQAKQKLDDAQSQSKEIISIGLEKEQIEINRDKIICIQSAGNYLEFFLRKSNGEIIKLIKRGRLHMVGKDLAPFPEFFRCHRAFIINLKQVNQIKGNVKNARLVFDGKIDEIPISRSSYKPLMEQLESLALN